MRLEVRDGETWAVPVFGKSNLIFTLVRSEGVVEVPLNSNGIPAGAFVTVMLGDVGLSPRISWRELSQPLNPRPRVGTEIRYHRPPGVYRGPANTRWNARLAAP